jgi:hypothetical protein
MGKALILYLVITGIAAIFTLARPELVFMLAFVGVGLVLAFTPTAFLWGCIFSFGYGFARVVVRPLFATAFAVVVTAITLWAVPQPSIRAANAALARFHLDDVTPTDLIRLQGDIRIDMTAPASGQPSRDWPGLPMYGCDGRCMAMLFEPDVRSVTITRAQPLTFEHVRSGLSQADNSSRTYRLVPKAQCGDDVIDIDARHIRSPFGDTLEERRAVAAEWSMKLAIEYCITGSAPLKRYDMMLRFIGWQSRQPGPPYGFDMSPDLITAKSQVTDIRDGKGTVLYRRSTLAVDALTAPLTIFPQGERFIFGWSRRFLPEDSLDWEKLHNALDAAYVVKRSADVGESIANARKAVQSAFLYSTMATGESATLVIQNYMEMLGKAQAASEDVALVEKLLADPRLDDLPGAWLLYRSFSPEHLTSFLPAIISKLSINTPSGPVQDNQLGLALEHWPSGAFANPDEATLTLLANPALRLRAIGLVTRMSDMGERAAPLLAAIIEQHVPEIAQDSSRDQLQLQTAIASVNAMCYLGPQAASELPRMRQLEMRELERNVPSGSSLRVPWDVMMLRLGKPLGEIRKVDDGGSSERSYINGLTYLLAHFDPNRDCRRG